MRKISLPILLIGLFTFSPLARASIVELFANGSVSKNYLATDSWTVSVYTSGGLAVVVIPHLRIEGRYTNIGTLQNSLNIAGSNSTAPINLSNIKTETDIYSLGLSVDFFSETATFKPYIYVGAGYVYTQRSYYYTTPSLTQYIYGQDTPQKGLSANLGLGVRMRLAQSIAFEVEAYGYAQDVQHNPLLNLYGTVGIRIFI